MNEFLNPKSMMTPGLAGSLVMFLANAIHISFPEIAFRYVVLALSCLIGILIIKEAHLGFLSRIGYWAVNSLVIFAVGIGSSNIGANITQGDRLPQEAHATGIVDNIVKFFVASPRAQEPHPEGTARPDNFATESARLRRELEQLRMEKESLHNQIEEMERSKARPSTTDSKPREPRQFFQRW